MKITYDKKSDDQREVIAFIDENDALCIKGDTGELIMIDDIGSYEGETSFHTWMEQCEIVKIFYRGSGDSVTITF